MQQGFVATQYSHVCRALRTSDLPACASATRQPDRRLQSTCSAHASPALASAVTTSYVLSSSLSCIVEASLRNERSQGVLHALIL